MITYTWEIQYHADDGYGVIQFCAHTKKEAMTLFFNWAKETHITPLCSNCRMVFNHYDAAYYGQDYGGVAL